MMKTPLFTAAHIIGLLLIVLVLTGCPEVIPMDDPEPDPNPIPAIPADTREFMVYSFANKEWHSINTILRAESDASLIYVEESKDIPQDIIDEILDEFSDNILPLVEGIFGASSDLDKNGKIILLLFDIDNEYNSSSYIAGYFHPNDLRIMENSNHGEILYLDTNPGLSLRSLEDFYSTITHELQHLINFASRKASNKPTQETWIIEGSAVLTEHVYRKEPVTRRIEYYYLWGGEEIARGNSFLTWGDGEQPVVDYSSSYLFFLWLWLHGGEKILPAIVSSVYRGYEAVIDVIPRSSGSTFFKNLVDPKQTNAKNWEQILAHWFAATIAQNPAAENDEATAAELLGFKGWPGIGEEWGIAYFGGGSADPDKSDDSTGIIRYRIDRILIDPSGPPAPDTDTDSMDETNEEMPDCPDPEFEIALQPGGRYAVMAQTSIDEDDTDFTTISHTDSPAELATYGIHVDWPPYYFSDPTAGNFHIVGVDTGDNPLIESPTAADILIVFNKAPSSLVVGAVPACAGTFAAAQPPTPPAPVASAVPHQLMEQPGHFRKTERFGRAAESPRIPLEELPTFIDFAGFIEPEPPLLPVNPFIDLRNEN